MENKSKTKYNIPALFVKHFKKKKKKSKPTTDKNAV